MSSQEASVPYRSGTKLSTGIFHGISTANEATGEMNIHLKRPERLW